jgi:hypothetical protein
MDELLFKSCIKNAIYMKKELAKEIISKKIRNVIENSLVVKGNGCAACHVLFDLSKEMKISEQDASDLLSEVLFTNPDLNDSFIDMVEYIHMKSRMMGTSFVKVVKQKTNTFTLITNIL